MLTRLATIRLRERLGSGDADGRPAGNNGDASSPGRNLSKLERLALLQGMEASVRRHLAGENYLLAQDQTGRTPLMLAASSGHIEICRLLLAAGADPTVTDARGCNAHTHALRACHNDVALWLANISGSDLATPPAPDDGIIWEPEADSDPFAGQQHELRGKLLEFQKILSTHQDDCGPDWLRIGGRTTAGTTDGMVARDEAAPVRPIEATTDLVEEKAMPRPGEQPAAAVADSGSIAAAASGIADSRELEDLIDAGRQRALLAIVEWHDGRQFLMNCLASCIEGTLRLGMICADESVCTCPPPMTDDRPGNICAGHRKVERALACLRSHTGSQDPRGLAKSTFDCIEALERLHPDSGFLDVILSSADHSGGERAAREGREGLAIMRQARIDMIVSAIGRGARLR